MAEKNPDHFIVRELGGGVADIAFDYRVMVKSKEYRAAKLKREKRTVKEATPATAPLLAIGVERLDQLHKTNETRRENAEKALSRLKERFIIER